MTHAAYVVSYPRFSTFDDARILHHFCKRIHRSCERALPCDAPEESTVTAVLAVSAADTTFQTRPVSSFDITITGTVFFCYKLVTVFIVSSNYSEQRSFISTGYRLSSDETQRR